MNKNTVERQSVLQRHTAKKIRNAGGRLKGMPERKPEQDAAFRAKLEELLSRG